MSGVNGHISSDPNLQAQNHLAYSNSQSMADFQKISRNLITTPSESQLNIHDHFPRKPFAFAKTPQKYNEAAGRTTIYQAHNENSNSQSQTSIARPCLLNTASSKEFSDEDISPISPEGLVPIENLNP